MFDSPNLDWLRKQAKRRLAELRSANPAAKLADAQLDLARQYGFPSWRALKARRVADGRRDADVTPLHLAVLGSHPDIVGLLLAAGADPTIRDSKHDSDAIGWAEFFRRVDIVQILRARQ